jgi:hypothetical protein
MTSKIHYTADEWKMLCDSPLAVSAAVAAAAPSDVVGAIKEGLAIINTMMSAARRHPNNQLIQEVVPKGVSREQIDLWTKVARTMMGHPEPERVKTAGTEMCQKVAMILQSKADPQEADEFKRWLLEVGEGVANAAREGGKAGANISSQETQILSELASALGVTHIPPYPPQPGSYQQP